MGLYRESISSGWRLAWKHKYLWIFGIFASLVSSGLASAWDLLYNNASKVIDQQTYLNSLNQLYTSNTLTLLVKNSFQFFTGFNITSVLAILIVLCIFIAFIWLAIVSLGALINASSLWQDGKSSNITNDFSESQRSFWRLLSIQAIGRLAIYGSILIAAAPLLSLYFFKGIDVMVLLFAILSFIIIIPFGLLVYFISMYASIYTVVEKTPIMTSVSKGWNLFKNNWYISVVFALVLFIINIIIGFLASQFLAIPAVIIVQSQASLSTYGVFTVLLLLAAFLVVQGALVAFQYGATVHFMKSISAKSIPSKFIEFLARKFKHNPIL